MDQLSDTTILNLVNKSHTDLKYLNSTIGYIKFLMTPIIKNFNNIIFPEYMSQGYKNKTKEYIISDLISDILCLSGNYVRDKLVDDTIYPWDINEGIKFDVELRNLLEIKFEKTNKYQYETEISFNKKIYNYNFKEDVIIGLAIFNNIYKSNYNIRMYGYNFTVSDNSRYKFNETTNYKITIDDQDYGFDNLEFLQGFASGAKWNNVDHHKYWKNLYNVYNDKYYTF